MKRRIELTVNNKKIARMIETNTTLLEFLRNDLNLTGTKLGCGNGECGACTVLMNGDPVRSCILLAVQADGSEILTIEGLNIGEKLHPIQKAFIESDSVQCGYCTPGMIMSTKALLDKKTDISNEDIQEALSGHLCRCTGYKHIIDGVKMASILINEK